MKRVSLRQFAAELPKTSEAVEAAVVRGFRSAAQRGVAIVVEEIDNAQPHPAVNLGDLRRSVGYEPLPDGAVLSVDSPHAAPINNGTRPFRPPLEPLIAWALQKGFANTDAEAKRMAWAVAEKIAEHGIEPRHYFEKAYARILDLIPEEVARELEGVQ